MIDVLAFRIACPLFLSLTESERSRNAHVREPERRIIEHREERSCPTSVAEYSPRARKSSKAERLTRQEWPSFRQGNRPSLHQR
jgi:hypothetical protein